jgi:hypothetical protein
MIVLSKIALAFNNSLLPIYLVAKDVKNYFMRSLLVYLTLPKLNYKTNYVCLKSANGIVY